MKRIKICLAALALAAPLGAVAGPFNAVTYGSVGAKDIASEVTDEFTKKFPTAKWSIFVWATSGVTNKGMPYCSAIAGVVPKGSPQFPLLRYESLKMDTNQTTTLNVGELRTWAVDCARSAVSNMMSDNLNDIYKPHA